IRRFLASAAGSVESRLGCRKRGEGWRAGARGTLRVPARAVIQQLLPEVSGDSRREPREESLPAVDDGFLPPTTRPHSWNPRDPGAGVYVRHDVSCAGNRGLKLRYLANPERQLK